MRDYIIITCKLLLRFAISCLFNQIIFMVVTPCKHYTFSLLRIYFAF